MERSDGGTCDEKTMELMDVTKVCEVGKRRFVIPGYDAISGRELPKDWVKVPHESGLIMYYDKLSGVATLSRPFAVELNILKSAPIPISAIPCLNYRFSKFYGGRMCDKNPESDVADSYTQKPGQALLVCDDKNLDELESDAETSQNVDTSDREEGELTSDEEEDDEDLNENPGTHNDYLKPPPIKRHCSKKDSRLLVDPILAKEEKAFNRPNKCGQFQRFLNPGEIRDYAAKLFNFRQINMPRDGNPGGCSSYGQRKFESFVKGPLPLSSEQRAKERICKRLEKSPICILHEYCHCVLKTQCSYRSEGTESDKQVFRMAAVINDRTFPVGTGNSKRTARTEAARLALVELLPEYKAYCETNVRHRSAEAGTSGEWASGSSMLSEADMQLFRSLGVTDRRVCEEVAARQLACAAPHTLFAEYVRRHCIPESEVHSGVNGPFTSNLVYEIAVGQIRVQVQCKNKRTGRNYAAQDILAKLHPHAKTWADLLDLYGPNTKPDRRLENEAILDAQTRQPSKVKAGVLQMLKEKMLELSKQLENEPRRKGKFSVSPDNLPVVHFHPDSNSRLYSFPPHEPKSSS